MGRISWFRRFQRVCSCESDKRFDGEDDDDAARVCFMLRDMVVRALRAAARMRWGA